MIFQFGCPHCHTPLKLQDRGLLGREFPCPGCQQTLMVFETAQHEIVVKPISSMQTATNAKPSIAAVAEPTSTAVAKTRRSRLSKKRKAGTSVVNATGEANRPEHAGEQTTDMNVRSPQRIAGVSTISTAVEGIRAIDRLKSPQGIAWLVALVMVLLGLLLINPFGDAGNRYAEESLAENESPSTKNAPSSGLSTDNLADKTMKAGPNNDAENATAQPRPVPAQRLEDLGQRLLASADRRGGLPLGTTAVGPGQSLAAKWGWLATLVNEDDQLTRFPADFQQAWHAPRNERFVRQSVPWLLNPNVSIPASPDRYPGTHFVGVGGVGEDGPRLDVNNPRAGAFGWDRETRWEDFRDGRAHTFLLLGVQQKIGAWAAGGPASVRPLTQAPYVNGPDGFGTGESNGMHVLMADGSVRFVSEQTSPLVMRQLATLADGQAPKVPEVDTTAPPSLPEVPVLAEVTPQDAQPDDGNTTGTPPMGLPPIGLPPAPGDPPSTPPTEPDDRNVANNPAANTPTRDTDPNRADNSQPKAATQAEQNPANQEPSMIRQQPAEPVKSIDDIRKSLALELGRFDQTKPTPRYELLETVEEMIGVPVRLAEGRLPRNVAAWQAETSINVSNSSIGDLLQQLVEPLGFTYEVRAGEVRLLPQK